MANNATKFGTVAVGSGISGVLIGLVLANSVVLQGNQVFDPTDNPNPKTQVYDSSNARLVDTIAYSLTGTSLYRPLNFVNNGFQSGATIKANGVTALQRFYTPCTNTGGLTKYPTCITRSPFTTTGALATVGIECGNTNKVLSMSGGYVKSTTASITSGFSNLNTVSVGTGAGLQSVSTGATLRAWNPADYIKFQTVTSIPSGGIDCQMYVDVRDKYGS